MIESTGHWTSIRNLYKQENPLVLDTSNPHFAFKEFIIPIGEGSMNNKQELNEDIEMHQKRREMIRTREEFILEVRKLSKIDKKYLNYSYLRKIKRSDLLYEAVKLFGGWRGAVQAAGFRPLAKRWTKDEIIGEIKKAVSEIGHVPRSKEVIKLGYVGLCSAAGKAFGGWTNALIEAGFKPFRRKWTKEDAIKELKEVFKELGHSPSMGDLNKLNKHNLIHAGLKFFGKYNNFLKAAKLEIVLEMNKWPKSKIINELQKIQKRLGRTPRRSELAAMKRYDLINAAETYFPCWSEALISAGLVPNSDVLNDDITWRQWENLIFELLLRKSVKYEKKKYIKKIGYPDVYIASQNKIIEIKLNCSENSVKEDIRKYLPHCKTLEVWYLYGKPCKILSNKVSFIGPNRIRDMLKNYNGLLNKFHEIKDKMEVNRRETQDKKSVNAW